MIHCFVFWPSYVSYTTVCSIFRQLDKLVVCRDTHHSLRMISSTYDLVHLHLWAFLCLNMVFFIDRLILQIRSGRLFLPISPCQISLSLPTSVLKPPSKTTESSDGAPSSLPLIDFKKLGTPNWVL